MADLRRNQPEPPPGMPRIEHRPGLGAETMREIAPLLAEEGIDLEHGDVPDIEQLQAALDRAAERRNMTLFTPVGTARDLAVDSLRAVVTAIADDETARAADVLEAVQPESPDGTTATVSACIGVALGLLDGWLSGQDSAAPGRLSVEARMPRGHWSGERAARDILALARKGRSFDSLQSLIVRNGGKLVLDGSAVALSGTVMAWARIEQVPLPDLAVRVIR